MGLPKIDQPFFETKLPSNNKKVKYRPFTVKEEKILLVAQEAKDMEQMILSIKQVINNCVVGIDVERLPLFDLEWLLMELRSKSVDNVIEIKIKDEDTQEEVNLQLNIDTLKVKKTKGHSTNVKLTDSVSAIMRYPSFEELKILMGPSENGTMDALINCVDSIVEGDVVYELKDFSEEEVVDFFDSLTTENLKEIKSFFDTMPKLSHELKYKNKNGDEKTFVIQGTEAFFI